jgi:hypothetical protein
MLVPVRDTKCPKLCQVFYKLSRVSAATAIGGEIIEGFGSDPGGRPFSFVRFRQDITMQVFHHLGSLPGDITFHLLSFRCKQMIPMQPGASLFV